jgi:hypothetical protein
MVAKIHEEQLPVIRRVSSLADDVLSDRWLIGFVDDSLTGVFSERE